MTNDPPQPRWRRYAAGAGLAAAGLIAGGILMSAVGANAQATGTAAATGSGGYAAPGAQGTRDESKPQRSDEKLLTGTTLDKVKAAALAKYPGATIQRAETDSDGVYEAHLVTSAGKRVTAEIGKDFTVTGEESMGVRGGQRGPGGPPPGGGE
ncbi:MAG: hypothetical protein JWO79_3482 [Actinomycetia bacterium]|jgi:hypothetical protein|nr:hypothetical protein [Actinomycetes bacterium]